HSGAPPDPGTADRRSQRAVVAGPADGLRGGDHLRAGRRRDPRLSPRGVRAPPAALLAPRPGPATVAPPRHRRRGGADAGAVGAWARVNLSWSATDELGWPALHEGDHPLAQVGAGGVERDRHRLVEQRLVKRRLE